MLCLKILYFSMVAGEDLLLEVESRYLILGPIHHARSTIQQQGIKDQVSSFSTNKKYHVDTFFWYWKFQQIIFAPNTIKLFILSVALSLSAWNCNHLQIILHITRQKDVLYTIFCIQKQHTNTQTVTHTHINTDNCILKFIHLSRIQTKKIQASFPTNIYAFALLQFLENIIEFSIL